MKRPIAERLQGLALVAVLALVAAAHAPALAGSFTNWDDPSYLLHNPLTEAPLGKGAAHLLTTPELGYAIPVTVLAYAGQRALFGLEPVGYHGVSLLLHLVVVALAFLVARRLGAGAVVASLSAALFGVHPITVEPVAWVVGQKDLLATTFMLAAVFIRLGPRGASLSRSALVLVLAVLALGAKPSAVAILPILIVIDLGLERGLRAPLVLALHGLVGVLAAISTAVAVWGHTSLEEPVHVGASALVAAAWAVTLQLGNAALPLDLSARYFEPQGFGYVAMVVVGVVLAATLIGLIVLAHRRGMRAVFIAGAAAILAYAPVSGVVAISRGPADSYLYLSLALLVTVLAMGLEAAERRGRVIVAGVTVAAAICGFTALTRQRARVWRDAPTLWADVHERYNDHPVAKTRLANALTFVGDYEMAEVVFDDAILNWPTHAPALLDRAINLEILGRRAIRRAKSLDLGGPSLEATQERLDARRLIERAEGSFAAAALHGKTRAYREPYALFLIRHAELEPSERAIAEDSLVELAPLLITRGRRYSSLQRAAQLLERFGRVELGRALRARADHVRAR